MGQKRKRQTANSGSSESTVSLVVGCLTSQQQAIVYLTDGVAQRSLRAATLR